MKKANTGDSSVDKPICQSNERISHLRSMCSEYKKHDFRTQHAEHVMFVNDKYKYVACLPHKAGSSSWKTILLNNSAEKPLPSDFKMEKLRKDTIVKSKWEPENFGIKRLSDYNGNARQRILKDYYKFMVVRHPLDRLLSCYMDKIVGNNDNLKASVTNASIPTAKAWN